MHRTNQRIFPRDDGWYVATRGGGLGPFPDRQMAVTELNRYIRKMDPRARSGLTTVETAVAGALITVAVVAAFTELGGSVAGTISIIDAVLPG